MCCMGDQRHDASNQTMLPLPALLFRLFKFEADARNVQILVGTSRIRGLVGSCGAEPNFLPFVTFIDEAHADRATEPNR
jgi:hypothetical protein